MINESTQFMLRFLVVLPGFSEIWEMHSHVLTITVSFRIISLLIVAVLHSFISFPTLLAATDPLLSL